MTLREAAQALARLDAMRPQDVTHGQWRLAFARLHEALALPDAPRGGWEEGAEAMRETAARALRERQVARKPSPARDALIEAEHFVRALPVPSAPPPAEPFEPGAPCPCGAPPYQWHKSTPLCTHIQTSAPTPAPEALPVPKCGNCLHYREADATDEVSANCMMRGGRCATEDLCALHHHRPPSAPEAKGDATMCAGCFYVTDEPACMLGFKLPLGTVCSVYRPAPVEPEETP